MTASNRGSRAVSNALASSRCSRCTRGLDRSGARRHYSATATAAAATPDLVTAPTSKSSRPAASPAEAHPSTAYEIRSGLILTRPPLVTRRLHPFENAFFFYQKRLEMRLNNTFVTNVFYKPDTARRLDWDLKVRERQGAVAKELGVYHGKNSRAWDDELRVGDTLSSQEHVVNSLLKDAEARVSDDAEELAADDVVPVEPPEARVTDADRTLDVRRLDRQLERTLYLVVKGKEGWGFPADVIPKGENLHEIQCARRVLEEAAGVNMNTWIVGRAPVAHVVTEPQRSGDGAVLQKGSKTFLLKGRIMAGQANLEGNPFGFTDFKWLTREELEKELAPEYLKNVRNMLADR